VKLYDYQEEGVKHLLQESEAVYLADKPGLGKTLQALTTCARLGARNVLILCPAGIVPQWRKEALLHLPQARVNVVSYDAIAISKTRKKTPGLFVFTDPRKESPATIKRRANADKLRAELKASGLYDVMILDEAHYLKEGTSARTRYVLHNSYGMTPHAKKVILLSGTPVLGNIGELYPVLRTCYPEALEGILNYSGFMHHFSNQAYGFNDEAVFEGLKNEDEFAKRCSTFFLARDEDVLPAFPSVTVHDEYIELEKGTYYDEIKYAEHAATWRRLTGEAKVKQLVKNIQEKAAQTPKLVVFYFHDSVRIALQRVFPNAPVIKGGQGQAGKKVEIEKFRYLKHLKVILVQLAAGGLGLDGLQHISNVGYLAELDWTPALVEQAIGRLRRIGQTLPVVIYRPIVKGSIASDTRLLHIVEIKRSVVDTIRQGMKRRVSTPLYDDAYWDNLIL